MGKKELTNKASILFSVKPKHSSLPSNKIVNETKKTPRLSTSFGVISMLNEKSFQMKGNLTVAIVIND